MIDYEKLLIDYAMGLTNEEAKAKLAEIEQHENGGAENE